MLLFISGALSIVLGVLAFRHFEEGRPILLLAIWIGVVFIFQGVAETALAIGYPQLPERGWHIFLGVLSIIAGMVVMAWPFGSMVMLAIVTGVWLVIIGIAQIVWALRARKGIKSVERVRADDDEHGQLTNALTIRRATARTRAVAGPPTVAHQPRARCRRRCRLGVYGESESAAARQRAEHRKNPVANAEASMLVVSLHLAVQRDRGRAVNGAEAELGNMLLVIQPAAF